MVTVNWILDDEVEDGDMLDYSAKGYLADSNSNEIGWSLSASPIYTHGAYTGKYRGSVRMRLGFTLRTIAGRKDFNTVESAMRFAEEQFNDICKQLDGLVVSQMQSILLKLSK